jgi:uncharacterized membrane protein YgdD (TMEM256/DUF423 family)
MHKNFIAIAAIFGGLAVGLGAFGAHGLEGLTKDEKILHIFQTGVHYQMYHALALLAVAMLYEKFYARRLKWAATFFIAGILLFSGSLYLLTFLKLQESNAVKFVGPVTPLGGVFFIAGWLFLFLAAIKKKIIR